MLKNELTKSRSSVELYFCKPLDRKGVREMTKEESTFYVRLLMHEESSSHEIVIDPKETPFFVKIAKSRLESFLTVEISDMVASLLCFIAKNSAEVVMMMAYTQYKAKERGLRKIRAKEIAEIFPMGFPSSSSLKEVWEGQKVERSPNNALSSDNLLDYKSAYSTINFDDPIAIEMGESVDEELVLKELERYFDDSPFRVKKISLLNLSEMTCRVHYYDKKDKGDWLVDDVVLKVKEAC